MSDEAHVKSHSPAVKVAGARITTHPKETEEKPLSKAELAKQANEYNSEILSFTAHELLSKEEIDFHDRSVKLTHTKPLPTTNKPYSDPTRRVIQQPK